MRLTRYLLVENRQTGYDEPRSKTISLKAAVDYVIMNCDHSLGGTQIKRDITVGWRDDARFTDPKKGKPRISRNTTNHYTLIVDNSPKWKRYPPRSQSIICTTREKGFYVFAENKSRFGVCPSYDFWPSFEGSGIWDMDGFNVSLTELAHFILTDVPGYEGIWDTSINQIRKTFAMIDEEKTKDYEGFMKKLGDVDRGRSFMSDSSNEFLFPYVRKPEIKLNSFIENLLDPNKNGFKVKFAGSRIMGEKEVWTDGKAILVNWTMMETFMNEINRRI